MYVPDILANGALRYPQRECVVQGARRLTFMEADERAARAAAAIAAMGIRPGERVALLARNEVEYLEILAACARGGFVVVPLNFRLAAPELIQIVEDASPSLLIYGSDLAPLAEQIPIGRRLVLGESGTYAQALNAAQPLPAAPIAADALWAIYYTGGTTGRSKGVMLTNGALYGRINEFTFEFGFRPGQRFLQVQPLFHMASQISACFALAGATNVFLKAFDAQEWLETVQSERITHVLLVPTIINMLCNSALAESFDLSSLQQVHYSASPITPDLLARALRVFPCDLAQSYGQTETGLSTILSAADHRGADASRILQSAGRPAVSSTVAVVGPDGTPLGPGAIGEVLHRGVGQMMGYWNAPELTADTIRNGWVHTGDLGYRSEDGYLFLVDRKKDMIITGGENVYAREVEDVLASHPAVLEVAVIGVPHPKWGEAVHAVVIQRPGMSAHAEELIAHCRARLAGYKLPKAVSFASALPKTPVGKIQKAVLRKTFADLGKDASP